MRDDIGLNQSSSSGSSSDRSDSEYTLQMESTRFVKDVMKDDWKEKSSKGVWDEILEGQHSHN